MNQALAQHALALLARLFRYGMTPYCGGFINLSTGACTPLSVEPRPWKQTVLRRRHEEKRRGSGPVEVLCRHTDFTLIERPQS